MDAPSTRRPRIQRHGWPSGWPPDITSFRAGYSKGHNLVRTTSCPPTYASPCHGLHCPATTLQRQVSKCFAKVSVVQIDCLIWG
jgi:hypothetical protein